MSVTQAGQPSFTFKVDDVEVTEKLLPEIKIHESLRKWMDSFESCSDYHSSIVRTPLHPFLGAVYLAFSQHRPLVLSPDSVWLTITRGVAQHMAIHGERLRDTFVSHQGKLDLEYVNPGFVKGSPENPWQQAFDLWTGQIRAHVGSEVYDALVCDFGTSTPTDVAASHVVMMDVFKKYFRYVAVCICGIPEITLTGDVDDWQRLESKVEKLTPFDMDWWIEHLLPICRQFTEARKGNVDVSHWKSICKLQDAYGGHIVNGWAAKLFPYVEKYFGTGDCTRRNPIFDSGDGIFTSSVGSGLSTVPFVFKTFKKSFAMQALGGLVGIRQNSETGSLEPISGWAVRDAPKYEIALLALMDRHQFVAKPAVTVDLGQNDALDLLDRDMKSLPMDLGRFLDEFESATFKFSNGGFVTLHEFDFANVCHWNGQKRTDEVLQPMIDENWIRIGRFHDERELLMHINFSSWKAEELLGVKVGRDQSATLAPVCISTPESRQTGEGNPVIAISLSDLFDRLAASSDARPYWEHEEFVPLCEARKLVRCFEKK